MSETNEMRVVRLEADAFKKLTAVEITPDGQPVILGGDNDAGKSTVLDVFDACLRGAKGCPDDPVQHGKDKAHTLLDLGTIVVKRTFTSAGGGALTVESKDGAVFKSPQAMLNKLYAHVCIDPEALVRDQGARAKLVAQLVDGDLEAWEAKRRGLYQQRADANREVKRLQAHAASLADNLTMEPDDIPAEAPTAMDVLKERDAVAVANGELQQARVSRQDAANDLARRRESLIGQREQIDEIRRQLEAAESTLATDAKHVEEDQGQFDGMEPIADDTPLDSFAERLEEIEEIADNVGTREQMATAESQAEASSTEAKKLTTQIEDMDREQAEGLGEVLQLVPHLQWVDGDFVSEGSTFTQLGSAHQLRVVTAVAMAANPHLKVLLVRNGSLLDENSLSTLLGMADEAGYHVWIERVGQDQHTTVLIEDGAVKEILDDDALSDGADLVALGDPNEIPDDEAEADFLDELQDEAEADAAREAEKE